MQKTAIISWNVNGIRAQVKKGFYEKLKDLDADIYCFQETKATVDIVLEIGEKVEGYHCYANEAEKKGYSGTAIFSKKKPIEVTYDIGVEEHDIEGRVITAEFDHFYLVNVYVPNSGSQLKRIDYRQKWDKDFKNYLENLMQNKEVVLTGDLNVAHQAIDLARPDSNYNKTAGYTQKEIDGFENFQKSGLVDSFRELYPEKIAYTFWNQRFKARERNVGWRIDYFMISQQLQSNVEDSEVLGEVFGSDHCPIRLKLK